MKIFSIPFANFPYTYLALPSSIGKIGATYLGGECGEHHDGRLNGGRGGVPVHMYLQGEDDANGWRNRGIVLVACHELCTKEIMYMNYVHMWPTIESYNLGFVSALHNLRRKEPMWA